MYDMGLPYQALSQSREVVFDFGSVVLIEHIELKLLLPINLHYRQIYLKATPRVE